MNFAPIDTRLPYWQKQTRPLFSDLAWNIPEQKSGHVAIVGGNSQSFSTVVRISEFLSQHFPFATVSTLLPDALRGQLPALANVDFFPSTASGSFTKSPALDDYLARVDGSLIIGDLSKNSATAVALSSAIIASSPDDRTNNSSSHAEQKPAKEHLEAQNIARPIVITRDSVDLLAAEAGQLLTRSGLILVASMAQLQKLFRAIYYPRMILLSQPLLPTLETLHKFTLTYPVTLVTFHQDNIIVAQSGKLITTPIIDTEYSPLSLWSGQLAARILALNLYNPGQPLAATTAALLYQ